MHGAADHQIPADWARKLHTAHPTSSRAVVLDSFGHNNILGAETVRSAILALTTQGLPGVDAVLHTPTPENSARQ